MPGPWWWCTSTGCPRRSHAKTLSPQGSGRPHHPRCGGDPECELKSMTRAWRSTRSDRVSKSTTGGTGAEPPSHVRPSPSIAPIWKTSGSRWRIEFLEHSSFGVCHKDLLVTKHNRFSDRGRIRPLRVGVRHASGLVQTAFLESILPWGQPGTSSPGRSPQTPPNVHWGDRATSEWHI
jgi:hypothetical protein